MSILNFITIHPIWFALIIIGIYFFIRFYIKPKYFGEKEELKEEQKEIPKSEDLKMLLLRALLISGSGQRLLNH